MDNKKCADNVKLVRDVNETIKVLDGVIEILSSFIHRFDEVDNRDDIFDNETVWDPIFTARDFRDDIGDEVLNDIKVARSNLTADIAAMNANGA